MRTARRWTRWVTLASAMSLSVLGARAQNKNYLARIEELRLPRLSGSIAAYYSPGYQQHAKKLQTAIEDMNVFFGQHLRVQTNVTLALLDADGWAKVKDEPYGLPVVDGDPPVIFMPATSGSPAFGLMMARKQAMPPEMLQSFLQHNHTTFEAVADQFVDLIGFHELGHRLTAEYDIDPKNLWFGEFLASYWCYAYIAERQLEWRRVFDLLGRPSHARPKITSLEDFERLYAAVDDYGWYQGMFEARIRKMYLRYKLKFLMDARRQLPRAAAAQRFDMKPQELLQGLEKIAPGFEEWAQGFSSAPPR